MKFYLCHTPEGRKRLVTRQDEAKKLDKDAQPIDIPVDQAGIKQGYEELFDQIFDLEQAAKDLLPEGAMSETTKALLNPEPKPESYVDRSVRFEDEFENMPLSLKLHYAALAMEEARALWPGDKKADATQKERGNDQYTPA